MALKVIILIIEHITVSIQMTQSNQMTNQVILQHNILNIFISLI